MDFSPQQQRAIASVARWLKNPTQPHFYLAGYAGSGKTTLAKHLAEQVDGHVLFAAYTGKAAHVLTTKGCPASTIHKLIYTPKQRSRERLRELQAELNQLRREDPGHPVVAELADAVAAEEANLQRPLWNLKLDSSLKTADLLVVDEVSMVDRQMGEDLLSFGVPILVLGDPAQLPPVAGAGYFTQRTPDFMLTEIHRQARDNPIIRMSQQVREDGHLPVGVYGDSLVVRLDEFDGPRAVQADQLLVGRNNTRREFNHLMRQRLGLYEAHPWPVPSDKLVCLRNNHDLGLLNGSLWTVEEAAGDDAVVELVLRSDDGERGVRTEAHGCFFDGEEPAWYERGELDEFDYGYALTVHKAQGSQWDDVVVFDEWTHGATRKQWLYTAVTRAAERLCVVKMRR